MTDYQIYLIDLFGKFREKYFDEYERERGNYDDPDIVSGIWKWYTENIKRILLCSNFEDSKRQFLREIKEVCSRGFDDDIENIKYYKKRYGKKINEEAKRRGWK